MSEEIPRRTVLGGVGTAVAGSVLGSGSVTATNRDGGRTRGDHGRSVWDTDDETLRSCAFNIRYDNPDDEPPWSERRGRVAETIETVEPDLLGVQEALPHQYDYLRENVTDYEWYGVGRDDGDREGEMVPVAWRRDAFESIETGEFWLSETPSEPSVGWGADLPRVTTWARLRHRETGQQIWFCSTHFSHVSTEARARAAEFLVERTRSRVADGDTVVVAGDFNAKPSREPYAVMTGTGDRPDSPLLDPRREADTHTVDGPWGTYHGFTGDVDDRIDYVFTQDTLTTKRYRTLPVAADGYRSDHLPVVADVELDGHGLGSDGQGRGGWWD